MLLGVMLPEFNANDRASSGTLFRESYLNIPAFPQLVAIL